MKMLPNILRNITKKSATRMYPVEVRAPFEDVRGELLNAVENCTFCGLCAKKCPSQCITVDRKAATWKCDPFVCVYCGVCAETCPTKCLSHDPVYRTPSREREMIFLQGEVKPKKKKKKKDEEAA